MSRYWRLVPVLGLASLVLFLALLFLFGTRRPTSFRFPVESGRVYDLVLRERPGMRERYSYEIRDQDDQDRDQAVGRYEIRVPNPEGADLQGRLVIRPATERALLEHVHLPRLPGSPFVRNERTWATLSEGLRVFQGGDGAGGETGRIVDLSRVERSSSIDEGCRAAAVAVHPEGDALAVVRLADGGCELEVWSRGSDGSWELASFLAELFPPVDPVWQGDTLWFLERRGRGGELRRWQPWTGAPPEPFAGLAGARRLLAVRDGHLWLGAGKGEFLLADGTGRALTFRAHPSLSLLRVYVERQDAFLVRVPTLDREGVDLVLRRRLGESSRMVRLLPEAVVAVSTSADLGVIVGVERCGNHAQ